MTTFQHVIKRCNEMQSISTKESILFDFRLDLFLIC